MTLSYDGHDLESLFICGEPELSILNSAPKLIGSDSMNGTLFMGMRYDVSTVAFTVVATGTAAERRGKFSTLGKWLMVDSPKQLVLPDTPDRYYLAVAQGALDLQRGFDGEYAKLTFTLTDPIARSLTVNSAASANGVAEFTVGGTAPTYVIVTATSAVPASSTNYWGVSITNGLTDYMRADIGTSSARVEINSEERTFKVGSANYAMTLYSKWLTFEPGTRRLYRINGSGEFTVQWRDRWY